MRRCRQRRFNLGDGWLCRKLVGPLWSVLHQLRVTEIGVIKLRKSRVVYVFAAVIAGTGREERAVCYALAVDHGRVLAVSLEAVDAASVACVALVYGLIGRRG